VARIVAARPAAVMNDTPAARHDGTIPSQRPGPNGTEYRTGGRRHKKSMKEEEKEEKKGERPSASLS